MNYTNWYLLEPNNAHPQSEDCIEFFSSPYLGQWNDVNCLVNRLVVCEKTLETIKECICFYGPESYCGTQKYNNYLRGNCNDNGLYFCPGANFSSPAVPKGVCPAFCMENQLGLDACPI